VTAALRAGLGAITLLGIVAPITAPTVMQQSSQAPQQIAEHTFLFSNAHNNLLVQREPRATFVAGVQDPALVARARDWLSAQHAPPVRWVLAAAGDSAAEYGDGGWGATGATVVAYEGIRGRMMGMRQPNRPASAPNAVPSLGFSEVVQLSLGDDEAHAVHQKEAGYGKSDVTVHIEGADVLYLGNVFTSDGYPDIDLASGGSIDGLIRTVDWFVTNFGDASRVRYVPGRGAVADAHALHEYRDMLTSVRDAVRPLVAAGKSDAEIVAARPTSAFDARWGHGRILPARFVTLVAQSLRRR